MKKRLFYILMMLFIISSCNYDNSFPEIKIISPNDGQMFNDGDLVEIKAEIKDDGDSIMNEELYVISLESNDTIFRKVESVFTFNYQINESFVTEPDTNYKIEVKARGGHGNWPSKSVNIISE